MVVAQDDDAFELREIAANLVEYRHIALAEDNGFRVAMVDNIAEPLAAQRDVERYGDAAQFGIAPPRIEKFRHVGQHHTHFVIFLNAHAFKCITDPIDALVELVVGDAFVFGHHCHFAGIHRSFVLEDRAVALPRIIHRVPHLGNFSQDVFVSHDPPPWLNPSRYPSARVHALLPLFENRFVVFRIIHILKNELICQGHFQGILRMPPSHEI